MQERRRHFLIGFGLIAASAIPGALAFSQSRRKSLPDPPMPGDPKQRDKLADPANPQGSQQTLLHAREQEFRSGVEKLYQLTGELREEIKTTPTTDVLSVKMYKRMQEIEKLAKQLESKVKG
jgi:hypothetical protein